MRLKDEKFYKTVRDFLDIYLIRHKGYSANTQKSYREALNLLLLYFKTELGLEYVNIGFEDITYSNITGFLEWLSSSRNCSPATINLRLMAIRSFTKYAGILDPAKIHTQVEISNISIRKMPGKVVEYPYGATESIESKWISRLLLYEADVRHCSPLPRIGQCKNR